MSGRVIRVDAEVRALIVARRDRMAAELGRRVSLAEALGVLVAEALAGKRAD